ncbi:MAG: CHAT domain-containing protein [Labedaea sp.]
MTIRLEPGTPVARAVTRARSARDAATADAACREAVGLATGATAAALIRDHVAELVRRRDYPLAHQRCSEYVESFPDDQILRLSYAEILCALAKASAADGFTATIDPLRLGSDRARLHRIRGLAATDRGDYDTAVRQLADARALFESSSDSTSVATIDRDLVMLGVRRGDPDAVAAALSSGPPRTPAECLHLARALKRELRYEESLDVLSNAGDTYPRLRSIFRDEKDDLRLLTRQDVPDSAATRADPDSPRFDRRLQHARLLVAHCRELLASRTAESAVLIQRSESALHELRPRAVSQVEQAAWHLGAGELELARGHLLDRVAPTPDEATAAAHEAEDHFRRAAELAASTASAEIRHAALRSLGHAWVFLGAGAEAVALWNAAYRIEEDIVARQISDDVKVRMLLAAGDERDEWIMAAAGASGRHGLAAAAAVAVAMEATRGQTITDVVGGDPPTLPPPGDIAGAYRWVRELTRDLPRDQVVWLVHASPDRVHHVLLGRNVLHHYPTSRQNSFRANLYAHITTLSSFCSKTNLEHSVTSVDFDKALAAIGESLDIGPVLEKLPGRVTRLAVVPYGILSRVPIAALPVPGPEGDRLVHRFAVSELPSSLLRRPLAHRGRRCRGERSLLVRPNLPEFTRAAELPGREILDNDDATPDRLSERLPGYHIVRLDCHGEVVEGVPVLRLEPPGPTGWLRPRDVSSMDLTNCGTIVLGACDSGAARRVGRDEPIGFVRDALHAGAAAIVAARWIAKEPAAAGLLDRFEHYMRYLPRDVALQRAQLDVCAGRVPHNGSPAHPARWACWTLYGDTGWQTDAGPLRRWLRAREDKELPCWQG